MKVICAGFPKTGTKSLGAALTKLGYQSVYDFVENGVYLEKEWWQILNDGWTTETFRKMYEDIDVVVDIPAAYFWEEISKAFPEAKIILTIRDGEDAWCQSFDKQLKTADGNFLYGMINILSPTQLRLLWGTGHSCGTKIFGDKRMFEAKWFGRKMNMELLKLKYRAHNAYVLQNAPPDRLLVFRMTDGWEPLCKFLDVPVPNEPFPHKNAKGAVVQEMLEIHPIVLKMQREMMVSVAILSSAAAAFGFLVYKKGFREVASWITSHFTGLFCDK